MLSRLACLLVCRSIRDADAEMDAERLYSKTALRSNLDIDLNPQANFQFFSKEHIGGFAIHGTSVGRSGEFHELMC